MSKHDVLALSKGTVLHIKNFKAAGFDPKNKYLYLIGHEDTAHVLAFVVSSQDKYSRHRKLLREIVYIPRGECSKLPQESWIQCFHCVHRLDVAELQNGFQQGTVHLTGDLDPKYLDKVRDVVRCSDVLSQYEIFDCLDAIDTDKSKPGN